MISTIIVNWNGYNDTSQCLNSLSKINGLNIFVVDNASSGDDYTLLKKNFPNIHIIRSETNLGFAGGNNLGLKEALNYSSDHFLLLNNDSIVDEKFLGYLIDKLKFDKNCGIVAPKINYYDNPNLVWSAGGKISKIRGSGFAIGNIESSKISEGERQVDFVSGCCMLIRREVFEKVGLLDDDFFLYLEDTDFCKRVIDAGYKIFVINKSVIYHKVSKSTINLHKPISLYYTTRNRLLFTKKHFPSYLPFTIFYIIWTMIFKSIFWIISGKISNAKAVLFAFKDFLAGRKGKMDEQTYRKL